jgi:chorismate mutase
VRGHEAHQVESALNFASKHQLLRKVTVRNSCDLTHVVAVVLSVVGDQLPVPWATCIRNTIRRTKLIGVIVVLGFTDTFARVIVTFVVIIVVCTAHQSRGGLDTDSNNDKPRALLLRPTA